MYDKFIKVPDYRISSAGAPKSHDGTFFFAFHGEESDAEMMLLQECVSFDAKPQFKGASVVSMTTEEVSFDDIPDDARIYIDAPFAYMYGRDHFTLISKSSLAAVNVDADNANGVSPVVLQRYISDGALITDGAAELAAQDSTEVAVAVMIALHGPKKTVQRLQNMLAPTPQP